MKKILTLFVILALSVSTCYASSFGRALKNAFKQDVKNTKTEIKATNKSIKNAIKSDYKAAKKETKQDIKETKKEWKSFKKDIKNQFKADLENSKKLQAEAEAARKNEIIKDIDTKLNGLNKELETVKNAQNITETERTIRMRLLQNQIKYYNKQKTSLK